MRFKSLSPVIVVEAIEPCLAFWTERLRFSVLAHVMHEGCYAFVLLAHGPVQVMLQTRASFTIDMPTVEPRDRHTRATFHLAVDDVDAVERALEGESVIVARNETSYGTRELVVREPSGNLLIFVEGAAL